LLWRSWAGTVRTSRILIRRRGLRRRRVLAARQIFRALQTGLNFVNDAEVADELRASRIDEVRLAIGAAINVYRREISSTRFFQAKSRERSEHQEHRAQRNAAVSKALRVEGAEPREDCFPAGDCFARAQSLVQNVVNEARRRFDLRKRM